MALNTVVAISMEKYPSDAPLPVKCCKIIRDITFKLDDWLSRDEEQFFYMRQSAPVSYPRDIPWELTGIYTYLDTPLMAAN